VTTEIAQESPIAEYRPTEAALADLRTKYTAVVYDVTDPKTMVQAKAARKELRDVRVALEAERVRIKAPSLQRSRDIDSEAKRITAELEALEDPIDAQIKSEEGRKAAEKEAAEQAERDRVAAINARFDALKARAIVGQDATAADIANLIAAIESDPAPALPEDLVPAWIHERRLVIASLRASLDRRTVYEAAQAELAALREQRAAMEAEQARLAEIERQRVADDAARLKAAEDIAKAEQVAKDAQEAAARAAEQAAIDQAAAVKAAEERSTREAEERERLRRDEEARVAAAERLAEEKRAANKRHQAKIHNEALAGFVAAGLSESQGREIIIMIATGRVPNITINY
jgi:colicin import membrane protein